MWRHGVPDIDALRRRSVDDPVWFWDAVVRDLDIPFTGDLSTGENPESLDAIRAAL